MLKASSLARVAKQRLYLSGVALPRTVYMLLPRHDIESSASLADFCRQTPAPFVFDHVADQSRTIRADPLELTVGGFSVICSIEIAVSGICCRKTLRASQIEAARDRRCRCSGCHAA